MPGAIPSLLLLTAAATAAFHTLIPDHWLPFVLVGRARGDLAPAAASDDLRTTVDYGLVTARIVEIGTMERVNLLERLAGRLAQMLLGEFPCREVRVRVRKLTPPMDGLLGIPGVELTRRR